MIEPLGYGWSSHPKKADYSFAAQTERVSQALDQLGVTRALFVAQSTGAAIAFRLAIARPGLVRGLLSIDGGPAESAATPGLRKAFSHGSFLAKLVFDETMLRSEVRQEIVRNSGDTSWVTDAVIHQYTAGQTADMHGAIDALQQMAKSKEPASLADRLHDCKAPVQLLVGTVPHPAGIGADERALLKAKPPTSRQSACPDRANTFRRSSRPSLSRPWADWTRHRLRRHHRDLAMTAPKAGGPRKTLGPDTDRQVRARLRKQTADVRREDRWSAR